MPSQTSDQFDAALRAGKIGGVYLFDGPDVWLKNRAVKLLIDKLLPAEARDFNLERFFGSNNSAGDILSSAQSLPFLAERRVVIVEGADDLSSSDRGLLGDHISDLPKSTCLVLTVEGKVAARDPLGAAALSHGSVVTFWTPFPNQMPRWVIEEVRSKGKKMDQEAAEALAESCQDLQQVANEVDKLAIFVGKKDVITLRDLLEFGLPDDSGDQKLFESALYERRLDAALSQVQLLFQQGIRPEILFPTMSRVFRQILLAQEYASERKMGWEDIASTLRLRGITQQRLVQSAIRAYTRQESEAAFSKIAEADFQMKTGLLPGEIAMTLLLVSVLRPRQRLEAGSKP